MRGLDDGPDGLNDDAFDRALGLKPKRKRARKNAPPRGVPMVVQVDDDDATLNNVLARLGWRSEPSDNASVQGKRIFDAAGCDLGIMYAGNVWSELRKRGLIQSMDGDTPYVAANDEWHEIKRCACNGGGAR